jgi:hypothetical protein
MIHAVGFAALISFMLVVTYFDIQRFLWNKKNRLVDFDKQITLRL